MSKKIETSEEAKAVVDRLLAEGTPEMLRDVASQLEAILRDRRVLRVVPK